MSWNHRTHSQEMKIIELTKDHCQREIAEKVGVSRYVVGDVQHKYHLVLSFGRSYHAAKFRYAYDESNQGKKRGKYKAWLEKLPRCETVGCETGVRKEGEMKCATCRRKKCQ